MRRAITYFVVVALVASFLSMPFLAYAKFVLEAQMTAGLIAGVFVGILVGSATATATLLAINSKK